jgi:tetratricopeptide (TPR) repeat protein
MYVTTLLALYASVQVEAGSEESAVEAVATARRQAEAGGLRRVLATVLLASAKLALRQARWDDAAAMFEAGLALTREIGLLYDEAFVLYEYARMDEARGEAERAPERLRQALAIFQRLGAVPDVERTEQALAGGRSIPPMRRGALWSREHEPGEVPVGLEEQPHPRDLPVLHLDHRGGRELGWKAFEMHSRVVLFVHDPLTDVNAPANLKMEVWAL